MEEDALEEAEEADESEEPESKLDALEEEQHGAWEELLCLLLPFHCPMSLHRALGGGFPHLQLLGVKGHTIMALGLELLTWRGLRMPLPKNKGLGGQGSLLKGLAQAPVCPCLHGLNLSGNCFQDLPASLMEPPASLLGPLASLLGPLTSLLELLALQTLSMVRNHLHSIPAEIKKH